MPLALTRGPSVGLDLQAEAQCREVLRIKQEFQSVLALGLSGAQPGNSEAAGTLTARAAA